MAASDAAQPSSSIEQAREVAQPVDLLWPVLSSGNASLVHATRLQYGHDLMIERFMEHFSMLLTCASLACG